MPSFVVLGVDRQSGMDTRVRVDAESPANARVKAELKGILVTDVRNQDGGAATAPAFEADYQPPPAPPSRSQETTYFSNGRTLVTSNRFVVGETTYSLRNVSSVTIGCRKGLRPALMGSAVFCFIIGLCGLPAGAEVLLVFVVIASTLFGLALLIRPRYVVALTTNAGEQAALESTDRSAIREVVESLQRAIAER